MRTHKLSNNVSVQQVKIHIKYWSNFFTIGGAHLHMPIKKNTKQSLNDIGSIPSWSSSDEKCGKFKKLQTYESICRISH